MSAGAWSATGEHDITTRHCTPVDTAASQLSPQNERSLFRTLKHTSHSFHNRNYRQVMQLEMRCPQGRVCPAPLGHSTNELACSRCQAEQHNHSKRREGASVPLVQIAVPEQTVGKLSSATGCEARECTGPTIRLPLWRSQTVAAQHSLPDQSQCRYRISPACSGCLPDRT